MTLGTAQAQFVVDVRPDPRRDRDPDACAAAFAHDRSVRDLASRADSVLQVMARARATVDALQPMLDHLPEDATAGVMALKDSLIAAFDEVDVLFFEPRDFKGYDHVTRRISDELWAAMSRNDWQRGPGPNAERALSIATAAIDDMSSRLEATMLGVWPAWQQAMEAVDVTPVRIFEATGQP